MLWVSWNHGIDAAENCWLPVNPLFNMKEHYLPPTPPHLRIVSHLSYILGSSTQVKSYMCAEGYMRKVLIYLMNYEAIYMCPSISYWCEQISSRLESRWIFCSGFTFNMLEGIGIWVGEGGLREMWEFMETTAHKGHINYKYDFNVHSLDNLVQSINQVSYIQFYSARLSTWPFSTKSRIGSPQHRKPETKAQRRIVSSRFSNSQKSSSTYKHKSFI